MIVGGGVQQVAQLFFRRPLVGRGFVFDFVRREGLQAGRQTVDQLLHYDQALHFSTPQCRPFIMPQKEAWRGASCDGARELSLRAPCVWARGICCSKRKSEKQMLRFARDDKCDVMTRILKGAPAGPRIPQPQTV